MADDIHGYRMTKFRKSCQRHNMMRKFLRPFFFGCGLAVLAAGFSLAQFHTADAEQTREGLGGTGALDNPYRVEALDLNPPPAGVPVSCPGRIPATVYVSGGT